MAKQTALITGASDGIGRELAKVFAREGYDLVITARSQNKLNELAGELQAQYGTQTRVIAMDLSQTGAPRAIFDELQHANVAIDVLVNNAGFASYGHFWDIDLEHELQEMQLNVVALTHLTKLFIKPMIERKQGKILNLGSTAGFQPGPLMAVYYATKAYVLSFSEALACEVEGTGVSVTVLCPGPTQSGFQKRADMGNSRLVQNGLMSSTEVAEQGYRALMQGKTISIPGLVNKVGTLLPRFTPRKMVTKIVLNMQKQVPH